MVTLLRERESASVTTCASGCSCCMVAGVPAKVIKMKDGTTSGKTELLDALRTL